MATWKRKPPIMATLKTSPRPSREALVRITSDALGGALLTLATFATLATLATFAINCNGSSIETDSGVHERHLRALTSRLDVGLKPGQAKVIGVRYETPKALPLQGEGVGFAIFGDPHGTTLSSDTGTTDSQGHARVEIRAGAAEATFEIHITAQGASPLIFSVQISKAGFSTLTVHLSYVGKLLREHDVSRVDVRLFTGKRCASLGPTDTSDPLRRQSVTSLSQSVSFATLPIDRDHTLHSVLFDREDRLRAWSCLEIPATLAREAEDLTLMQALDDATPLLAGIYDLTTTLILPKANRPLAAALDPWANLTRCPSDPAQEILDCILDARDPGDPLDCVIEAPSPETQALLAERGSPIKGCRPEKTARGGATIDSRLAEIMAQDGKDILQSLKTLKSQAPSLLSAIELHSVLELSAAASNGRLLAKHRLVDMTFPRGLTKTTYKLSKLPLGAPLGATAIAAHLRGWHLELSAHALSLRPGLLLRQGLSDEILTPTKIPADSTSLVQRLANLVHATNAAGQDINGCAAIEKIVCTTARLPSDCLKKACPLGLLALASRLEAGFAALDQHGQVDLFFGGEASVADTHGRLRVDRIGNIDGTSTSSPGRWTTATLHLADEALEIKEATFTGRLAASSGN